MSGPAVKILVVDDEPVVRRFASRVLREEGFGVHEAVDGEEALDLIRDGLAHLDIVLSDIVMPRMNGADLAKQDVKGERYEHGERDRHQQRRDQRDARDQGRVR